MDTTRRGDASTYALLVLTTALWGSLFVAARIVLETVPPLTVLFCRYAVASTALLPLLRARERAAGKRTVFARRDVGSLLVIGLVGYSFSVGAQLVGTKYAGASVASLINAMNPVAIAVFAALLLKERITPGKAVAIVAAVTGSVVILGGSKGGGAAIGLVFSLVSVTFWSLSSVVARGLTQKYDPFAVTARGIALAAAATLPAAAIELAVVPHGPLFTPKNLALLAFLGYFCTALPHVLWNRSLSKAQASVCSLFYPVQPLTSVLLGAALLGERIDLRFAAGAALIVGGIVYAVRS